MENIDWIQQDRFLRLVMDNIPQYVFWKDLKSIYQGCNLNFAKSAGLINPEEIIGKTDYDLPWTKEEADFFREVDQRVMQSGKSELNFEEPQTLSNGKTVWLRTSKVPLLSDEGKVIGILGTYEDITERKEVELDLVRSTKALGISNQNLKKVNLELEQAYRDLEQFSFAASHDLQEPLRTITNFTNLLGRKCRDEMGQEANLYMQYIKEGAERMSTLIQGVLAYSEANREEDSFSYVLLADLINEQLHNLAPFIEGRRGEVTVQVPQRRIKCQQYQIGALFYNLIHNGLKFNRSPKPLVEINFEERDQEWLFTVSDNGIGIEKAFDKVIYSAFKRLNNREEFMGNGIGLSICKRIVHLHQGTIWHHSDKNLGTKFYFTLSK